VQAQQSFAQLPEFVPGDVNALQFLATRHLLRRDAICASSLLLAAEQSARGNANIVQPLGTAKMAVGDLSGSARTLRHTVTAASMMFMARLGLGTWWKSWTSLMER
jgi:Flp pilus assembly protein TadD